MQSFERMLDTLKAESHLQFDTLNADRLKDLKKFLMFCHVYSQHHYTKEEILFDYARTKEEQGALQKICQEHKYGAQLYNLMEAKASDIGKESELSDQDNNGADHNEKINEVCIPSKTYIHNLYDHMQVEDDVIYPNMEQLFNEQEMEELSQKVDELSYQQANTIKHGEITVTVYTTHVFGQCGKIQQRQFYAMYAVIERRSCTHQKDHAIIERMLDTLKAESHLQFDTLNADRLKDLKKFLMFCHVYSQHHYTKEEILFDYARTKEEQGALQKICQEHKYGAQLYNLMEVQADHIDNENDEQDYTEKVQEVYIPSKTYIHNLYDHIQVEDDVIYPSMEAQFNEQEMEELSQKVDELNDHAAYTINAMELLADELNEKYEES
eukprot:CAMPEP_0202729158 /NCGR_PEP_ID=MMETSP1385-20130828/185990_1 /ASSEMBLY_ACC=CAM_ASM_000861 /TAXON_ID=933848 /ORGANISM="Elphidium margaritaceum" /LENGTH=381 /DNA_ID=CAMNT_0049395415 /DNA_START=145 /DNA_END=1291 /DNA_ORIENTATION=-